MVVTTDPPGCGASTQEPLVLGQNAKTLVEQRAQTVATGDTGPTRCCFFGNLGAVEAVLWCWAKRKPV